MFPETRKVFLNDRPGMEAEYPLAISLALREEVGGTKHAIKRLSRWTGANERTVQNWLCGTSGPSGPHLVALAKRCPAVRSKFLELSGERQAFADTDNVAMAIGLLKKALDILSLRAEEP